MTELLAWTDVETTGLNPWQGDNLLEIACVVTGPELKPVDDGFHAVLRYDREEAAEMRRQADPFVQQMHDKTGLWELLPQGTGRTDVDRQLYDYLCDHAPDPRMTRVAGNSVRLDVNFIEAFLPDVYRHLHYRVLDVSSLAYVAEYMMGITVPDKQRRHSALDDVHESIQEMRYYRERLMS